jgi:hypothetical protein
MDFSSAYDEKPVLATYGASPWIITARFIEHFSCCQELICSNRKIRQIIKYFGTENTNIFLFLSGNFWILRK